MRAYTEQDFEHMASRIVDRFMGGAKLADVAALEAQEGQLNPDQIDRLVQSANTMAFLRLMDQQKAQGTPDMTGEFDPIDARQIMHLLMGAHDEPHGMAAPHAEPHAEPMGDEGPLPDEMGAAHAPPKKSPPFGGDADDGAEQEVHVHGDESEVHVHDDDSDNDGPFPKGQKQKAKDDEAKKDKPKKEPPGPPKKDEAKEAAFRARRMSKLAGVLEDQFRQAELVFDETFDKLATCFRRASGAPSHDLFEKDALALHGDPIGLVVLNMVKESQGLPPIEADAAGVKTAALADRHLVEDTEPNRLFATLVKIATEATRLRQGVEHARAQCG